MKNNKISNLDEREIDILLQDNFNKILEVYIIPYMNYYLIIEKMKT